MDDKIEMKWCPLILLFGIAYAEALDCGIGPNINSNLKKAITSCLRANMTLGSIFDFSTLTSKELETATSKMPEKTTSASTSPNPSISEEKRLRMSRAVKKLQSRQTATTTLEPEPETEATTVEVTLLAENCIIQCVLSNLDLTDQAGYPEQQKVLDGLLKNANGRELRDFVQDTADNCFQKVNEDAINNSCDYSSELVKCLANSGKSNCADWPAGDISLFD